MFIFYSKINCKTVIYDYECKWENESSWCIEEVNILIPSR